MSDQANIKVNRPFFNQLKKLQREGESMEALLKRLIQEGDVSMDEMIEEKVEEKLKEVLSARGIPLG